jgi:hypothetical protein
MTTSTEHFDRSLATRHDDDDDNVANIDINGDEFDK